MTDDTSEPTGTRSDDQGRRLAAGLRERIEGRTARVGIIGLGYVGLPLARALAQKGIAVLGFDVDAAKVDKLQRGESYIGHIGDGVIREMRSSGRFEATDQFTR